MPLSAQLRALTQPQHDEAEHHPLHAVLFGSEGEAKAREAYVRLLGQHLHIQEAFEPLLRRAAQADPFRPLMREYHYHLDALREDLAALGVMPNAMRPCEATTRFVSFIRACAEHEARALLGVFYVFEGSTNGGTIIGKKMKELLGLEEGVGTRFINPHGPLVRQRWAEWKSTIDTLAFDDVQRHAIIAAAQEAFRLSHAVLDDVYRAMRERGALTPEVVACATTPEKNTAGAV